MEPAHVLIADDEAEIRRTYAELLSTAGHAVDTAADGDEVLEKVRANDYDMLLTDLRFPPTDGVTILREVKRIRPRMLVVIFTGHASVDSVVDSFRSGAFDFVPKPMAHEKLLELASRAADRDGGDVAGAGTAGVAEGHIREASQQIPPGVPGREGQGDRLPGRHSGFGDREAQIRFGSQIRGADSDAWATPGDPRHGVQERLGFYRLPD